MVTNQLNNGAIRVANNVTCVDDDGAGPLDCPCHASFASKGNVTHSFYPDGVQGLLAAIDLLKKTETTVVVAHSFSFNQDHPIGASIWKNEILPVNLRPGLNFRFGILLNGAAFNALTPNVPLDAIGQRFGEAIAHEFGHLAGRGHLASEGCNQNEFLMCPEQDINAPAALPKQQNLLSEAVCSSLYVNEDLTGHRYGGLEEATIRVNQCSN